MTTIYFKTMKIFENNLSGVEPYLLARAIVQLDEVGFIVSIVIIIIITIIIMDTQHIPTMTKSHHGGEVSVMMKVGMCQCQKPTNFGVYMYIR